MPSTSFSEVDGHTRAWLQASVCVCGGGGVGGVGGGVGGGRGGGEGPRAQGKNRVPDFPRKEGEMCDAQTQMG